MAAPGRLKTEDAMRSRLFLPLILMVLALPAQGADRPANPAQQTRYGLYVTASEAHALMTGGQTRYILVDVRDPIETMFTGSTAMADIQLPWMTADPTAFDPGKGGYEMVRNPHFLPELESRLAALKADRSTPLIIMCRSGSTRSAPVADLLYEHGYAAVYSMVDGFEGEPAKDGPHKGVRLVGGWRNSGLPWGYRIDPAKAWKRPEGDMK